MANSKEKPIQIVAPKGVLKFPRVSGDADFRFDKERGEYSTKYLLEPEAPKVQEFLKRLDALTDVAVARIKEENKKDAKKVVRGEPYTMETDKDGNETGKVELKFSLKHKITAKTGENAGKVFYKVPTLYDRDGKPMDHKTAKVGGGTVAQIAFEVVPNPYFVQSSKQAGITKRLVAIKILNLVEWGTRDASSFGFDDADDDDTETFPATEASGEESTEADADEPSDF